MSAAAASKYTMQAIVNRKHGSPDELRLEEIDRPALADDGVLVRVRAASVNPLDWHFMRGLPYVGRPMLGLRKPRRRIPGVDAAGRVEAVGKNVTRFRPGDEVFGAGRSGSLAEYACGKESDFAPKPAGLSFEQAAAIPIAGVTALQALRDRGRLQPGQSVLINGAAGGVGTFAIQIAKALGGDVTGVCSTKNVDLIRSLGADQAVDYSGEDFAQSGRRYDLVIDLVSNRSLSDLRRALAPKGTLVLSGGGGGRLLGPIPLIVRALVRSPFVSQRMISFTAEVRGEDLVDLTELIEAGEVTPVIDRTFPLREAPEAIRYLETGHARGKIVITV